FEIARHRESLLVSLACRAKHGGQQRFEPSVPRDHGTSRNRRKDHPAHNRRACKQQLKLSQPSPQLQFGNGQRRRVAGGPAEAYRSHKRRNERSLYTSRTAAITRGRRPYSLCWPCLIATDCIAPLMS